MLHVSAPFTELVPSDDFLRRALSYVSQRVGTIAFATTLHFSGGNVAYARIETLRQPKRRYRNHSVRCNFGAADMGRRTILSIID
jgi:hypothetical protein